MNQLIIFRSPKDGKLYYSIGTISYPINIFQDFLFIVKEKFYGIKNDTEYGVTQIKTTDGTQLFRLEKQAQAGSVLLMGGGGRGTRGATGAIGATGPSGGPTGATGATGPSGGNSDVFANALFVDDQFGDDTNAQPFSFMHDGGNPTSHKYKTITAAQAAAVSGQTIVVYPGTYAESGLGKAGVNYHFIDGAIVNSGASHLWIDTGGISYTVTGDGEFNSTSGRVIFFENIGTTLLMGAKSLSSTTALTTIFVFPISLGSPTKIYANIQKSIISTAGRAIILGNNAELYINTILISAGGYAVASSGYAETKLYINAQTITGTGDHLFDLGGIADVYGKLIYTGISSAITNGASVFTDQNYYGDLENDNSAFAYEAAANLLQSGIINFYGRITGIGVISIASNGPSTATHIFHNEITTNIADTPSVLLTTPGATIKVLSRVKNLAVGATAYAITKENGILILENAILVTSGATESIHSTTPQNVINYGVVQKVAEGASITYIVGTAANNHVVTDAAVI